MPRLLFALVPAALLLAAPVPAADPPMGEWKPLFNGKDLTGWTPKIRYHALGENYADTFRVEDGVLKVKYDKYDQFNETFGHLFYERPLGDYRLKVEYRFVGDQCKGGPGWATRNSGVMLHCQDPKSMAKDQDFPVSIEAQFLGGLGKGARPTCNVCTPGTNIVFRGKLHTPHCTNSKSKTFDGDQWVTAELEVRGGGAVRHYVNGDLVLEYSEPQLDPKGGSVSDPVKSTDKRLARGYIALQAESHPVEFRKVEVMEYAK